MSAKLCKYGCGATLTWDNATRSFKELDGTSHSKERCESLKKAPTSNNQNINQEPNSTSNNRTKNPESGQSDHMVQLVQAIRELTAANFFCKVSF